MAGNMELDSQQMPYIIADLFRGYQFSKKRRGEEKFFSSIKTKLGSSRLGSRLAILGGVGLGSSEADCPPGGLSQ